MGALPTLPPITAANRPVLTPPFDQMQGFILAID